MYLVGSELREEAHARTNISRGTDWQEKIYLCKVRRFAKGQVEVITHRLNPEVMRRFSESAMLGGLVTRSRKKAYQETGDEVVDEQKAQELAEKQAADNKARSIRRARQQVRFGVKAIGADHLLTLTYRTQENAPMGDLERLKADWDRFRRLVKRGLPASEKFAAHRGIDDWRFVAIRERQDNGAYHLHVAVVGRQDIGFIRRCWFVAIGGSQDDEGASTLGNIDVRGPSKRWGSRTQNWRPDKLSGYMTKYLSKTFDDETEKRNSKRYWAGRNNAKPELVKFYLNAQDFAAAIIETHGVFRAETVADGPRIWGHEGYGSVWFSG